MRLTSIKLAGFKSFVEPTTVRFPNKLTAIVGPNGSGKSNIIDAVRWVMGESSAKNLRGESMADVIFNGSSARKPVGQASIELLFDNSDASLGGQYAQYSQISIKRLITKDAQSVYYLNGGRCRRRDISDIFLGTGLGSRSYAIIMQDTISRLIDAKPEEFRVHIEEAAGISKYKERRRETELRIRHTRDNLDRLNDLREELGHQLDHLQRQAKAAERYKALKQEERLYKAQLQALRWQELDAQLQVHTQQIQQYENEIEAVVVALRRIDASIEEQREAQTEVTDTFNLAQKNYYSTGAQIARLEQSKQHQLERQQQLVNDYQRAEENLTQARTELAHDAQQMVKLEDTLNELEPAVETAQSKIEQQTIELSQAEQLLQTSLTHWDSFTQASTKVVQQAQIEQMTIQHLEQRQFDLNARYKRLQQERGTLDHQPLDEELKQTRAKFNEKNQTKATLHSELKQLQQHIRQQKESNQAIQQTLNELRSKLQQSQGKHASLDALQQVALGQKDEAVNAWLQENNLAAKARLGQQLQVTAGWEVAVEVVLNPYLEAVCIANFADVAQSIAHLPQASVMLVEEPKPQESQPSPMTLASKVKHAGPLRGLLETVYVATDFAQALTVVQQLKPHESVVSQDGIYLGPGWLRCHKAQDAKAGVLQRQQELQQLVQAIQQLKTEINTQEDLLQQGNQKLTTYEQQNQAQQQTLRELTTAIAAIQTAEKINQQKHQQLNDTLAQIEQQSEEIQQALEKLVVELRQHKSQWQQAVENAKANETKRSELLQARDQQQQQVDQLRQALRQQKDHIQQLRLDYQASKVRHDSIQQNHTRNQAQLSTLETQHADLDQALENMKQPLQALEAELSAALAAQSQAELELQAVRQRVENVNQQLHELSDQRMAIEDKLTEQRSQLEQARVDAQSLQVRRTTFTEQITEAGFELKSVMQDLPAEANATQWDEKLAQLHKRIERLGAINLAAIDEFKTLSERKTYLDAQNDDLIAALTTLENAIHKIDKETKQRFKETYDKANQHFQNLFPRVFGGGSASLELTGDDLLETGVAVMARPPGKRNSTIHLLSGGEKALTAISLVFALFQLNPAPFCMLDEVDAPLDDANVVRFCNLVKEMAQSSQFIFISHNKLAIEMAENLVGVSMREAGVSRLVTVDVAEAVAMAEV